MGLWTGATSGVGGGGDNDEDASGVLEVEDDRWQRPTTTDDGIHDCCRCGGSSESCAIAENATRRNNREPSMGRRVTGGRYVSEPLTQYNSHFM